MPIVHDPKTGQFSSNGGAAATGTASKVAAGGAGHGWTGAGGMHSSGLPNKMKKVEKVREAHVFGTAEQARSMATKLRELKKVPAYAEPYGGGHIVAVGKVRGYTNYLGAV